MGLLVRVILAAALLAGSQPVMAQDYSSMSDAELSAALAPLLEAEQFVAAIPAMEEVVDRYEASGILTSDDGIAWVADLRQGYRAIERDDPLIELTRRVIAACEREQGRDSSCIIDWHQILAQDLRIAKRSEEAYFAYENWRAVATAARGEASEEARQARWDSTFFLQSLGLEAEAIEIWEKSYSIEKTNLGPNDDHTVEHAGRLVDIYMRNELWPQAEALARDVAATLLRERGADGWPTQLWHVKIASALKAAGDLEGAKEILLGVLEATENTQQISAARYNATSLLRTIAEETGDFESVEAVFLAELAEARTRLDEDPMATEESLMNLAESYQRRNELAKAEQYYLELLALYESRPSDAMIEMFDALIRQSLAEIYTKQGRFDEAQKLNQVVFEEFGEDGGTFRADAIISLAQSHSRAGEYGIAETVLLDAIAENYEPQLVSALARLYLDQNRLAEAESLLLKRDATGELRADAEIATSMLLGELFLRQGQPDRALTSYRFMVDQARSTAATHPGILIDALYGLAKTQRQLLRSDLAIEHIEEAIRLYGPNASPTNSETLHLYIERSLIMLVNRDIAEGFAQLSGLVAAASSIYGDAHEVTLEAARELASRAYGEGYEAYANQAAKQLTTSLDARLRLAGTGSLDEAQIDREAKDRRAIYALVAAISENASDKDEMFELAFAANQELMSNPASAAVVRAAARRFADDRQSGLGALVQEREELQTRYAFNAAQFAGTLRQRGEESVATRQQATGENTQISARLEEIEGTMLAQFPEYFDLVRPSPLDTGEARALLRSDEAALVIVPSRGSTAVFTVTSEKVSWRQVELGVDEIAAMTRRLLYFAGASIEVDDETIFDWEREVDGGFYGFDRDTAYRLYRELIAPSEEQLEGKQHLFIAAHGALSSLPFAMLVTEQPEGEDDDAQDLRDTRWMADRYTLVQLPTLQSLAMLRRQESLEGATPFSFAGFGDPVLAGEAQVRGARKRGATRSGPSIAGLFDENDGTGGDTVNLEQLRSMARLPGTARELQAMAEALETGQQSIRLADEATEANFKQARLDNVAIIALATHGLVAGEIEGAAEPGLVFTPPAIADERDDGYLTASEVAALRLNADWVILSACNTAAGDGSEGASGLSGLARAFFFAGAGSLLASHWPVRDDVAAQLTVRTIEIQRSDPDLTRAQAFQLAMREVRLDPSHDNAFDSWAHPNAWAPFTLIGDGAQ